MERSSPLAPALSPSTGERENLWQSRVEHISGNFLRDGPEFVAVSRDLFFSPGAVRWCMVIHDETRASLACQKRPDPLDKNAYSEIGCGEKLDVYPCPRQPRE